MGGFGIGIIRELFRLPVYVEVGGGRGGGGSFRSQRALPSPFTPWHLQDANDEFNSAEGNPRFQRITDSRGRGERRRKGGVNRDPLANNQSSVVSSQPLFPKTQGWTQVGVVLGQILFCVYFRGLAVNAVPCIGEVGGLCRSRLAFVLSAANTPLSPLLGAA